MSRWYRSGTVSISNGSSAVTGLLTAFNNQVKPGDSFSVDGGAKWYEIASVDGNTTLTLATTFAESTVADADYAIQRTSPLWSLASDLATQIGALLAAQTDILTGTGAPGSDFGTVGSVYIDTLTYRLYGPKTADGWGSGTRMLVNSGLRFTFDDATAIADPGAGKLAVNNASPGSATKLLISKTDADGNSIAAELATWYGGTSVNDANLLIRRDSTPPSLLRCTVTAGADHTDWVELTITNGSLSGALLDGDSIFVAATVVGDKGEQGIQGIVGVAWQGTWSNLATYAARDVVYRLGSSYRCLADGTTSDPAVDGVNWTLVAHGAKYASSSTSSHTPGTGSKAFTVEALLGFSAGSRARFSSAASVATNWMEGVVTDYTGTTLTVTIDKFAGSGAHTDWLVNITGEPGSGDLSSTNNLSDVANAATARSNLGLAIGTNVQAYDAELAALAGLTSAANKVPRFTGSGTAGLLDFDTDGTFAANSDSAIASQKAVKTYVDQIIGAQDAMVFKGVIDCSANPNYPAADRGWTYRVSVAGKIGGASGTSVEAGDIVLCLTDSTSSGNQATVGTAWTVIQTNLDGAVIGPASATDGNIAQFDGASGKLLKGGLSLDTDGSLSANSDTKIASQKAVKSYAQPLSAILSAFAGLSAAADKIAYFTGASAQALTDFTTFGRSLVGAASASAARTVLGLVIGTDVQAYSANAAFLNVAQTWSKVQGGSEGTLTSASAWDGTDKQLWAATVNGGNFTIANPSGAVTGRYYAFYISYTTSHSLLLGNQFKGVSTLSFTNTAGAIDHLVARWNGTNMVVVGARMNIGA